LEALWASAERYLFRTHHTHSLYEVWPIATEYRQSSLVYLLVMFLSPVKMAEPIETPFERLTQVGSRNHLLYRVQIHVR